MPTRRELVVFFCDAINRPSQPPHALVTSSLWGEDEKPHKPVGLECAAAAAAAAADVSSSLRWRVALCLVFSASIRDTSQTKRASRSGSGSRGLLEMSGESPTASKACAARVATVSVLSLPFEELRTAVSEEGGPSRVLAAGLAASSPRKDPDCFCALKAFKVREILF
jgi:hypothetical protein